MIVHNIAFSCSSLWPTFVHANLIQNQFKIICLNSITYIIRVKYFSKTILPTPRAVAFMITACTRLSNWINWQLNVETFSSDYTQMFSKPPFRIQIFRKNWNVIFVTIPKDLCNTYNYTNRYSFALSEVITFNVCTQVQVLTINTQFLIKNFFFCHKIAVLKLRGKVAIKIKQM